MREDEYGGSEKFLGSKGAIAAGRDGRIRTPKCWSLNQTHWLSQPSVRQFPTITRFRRDEIYNPVPFDFCLEKTCYGRELPDYYKNKKTSFVSTQTASFASLRVRFTDFQKLSLFKMLELFLTDTGENLRFVV